MRTLNEVCASEEGYALQVDLEALTRQEAEEEADQLIVIPRETLEDLITMLEGRLLRDGETIAGNIESIKEYM